MDEEDYQPCTFCEGIGKIPVTRDMALDSGDLFLERTLIPCPFCGGEGYRF